MLQMLLYVAFCAHADPVLTSAALEARELPRVTRAAAVFAGPAAGRPAAGWVNGDFALAPVDLVFDRRQWTIDGSAVGRRVYLNIDHSAHTITGQLGRPVALSFTWSTQRWTVLGDGVDLAVDWNGGSVSCASYGRRIQARFSLKEGWIKGDSVDLKLQASSGRLTGKMNGVPVDATLTNLDLSDLLMHLYVFCAP